MKTTDVAKTSEDWIISISIC